MSYYTTTLLDTNFDNAIERVTEALKAEGFGILTEIKVNEVFKNKLDIDFRNYRILGACNPGFAHQAIQKESKVGVMLPCNVIVQETDDGKIEVSAVNPIASMQAIENDGLHAIAQEVEDKLKKAIQSL
ncbi:MAG: DUF302 domain-containing protein [Balneolaceae bacterium]